MTVLTITRRQAAQALAALSDEQAGNLAGLTPAELEFVLLCVAELDATVVVAEAKRVRSRPYDPRTAAIPF